MGEKQKKKKPQKKPRVCRKGANVGGKGRRRRAKRERKIREGKMKGELPQEAGKRGERMPPLSKRKEGGYGAKKREKEKGFAGLWSRKNTPDPGNHTEHLWGDKRKTSEVRLGRKEGRKAGRVSAAKDARNAVA